MADDDKKDAKDTKQSNWFLAALHSFLDDREVEKQNKANEQFKDMFKNAAEVSPHYIGHGGPGGRGGRGMVTQDVTTGGGGAQVPGLVQAVGRGGAYADPSVSSPFADTAEASVPKVVRPPGMPYWDDANRAWTQDAPEGAIKRRDLGKVPPSPGFETPYMLAMQGKLQPPPTEVLPRPVLTPDEEERMRALSNPIGPNELYAPQPPPPVPLVPLDFNPPFVGPPSPPSYPPLYGRTKFTP